MGSGMARGAAARGKRIAFGDGRSIIWNWRAEEIYRYNPNVAPPTTSRAERDLEWIAYYPSSRIYNRHSKDRWIWNYDYKAKPGEIYFSKEELAFSQTIAPGLVLIEPNVTTRTTWWPNKQWPVANFQAVADALRGKGYRVAQLEHGGRNRLQNVERIRTANIRMALAALSKVALYIGPEGGMHHGAAAVGVNAVVLFGGFVPPSVTGYDTHINLAAGGEACGSFNPCAHCAAAMKAIPCEAVIDAAVGLLNDRELRSEPRYSELRLS